MVSAPAGAEDSRGSQRQGGTMNAARGGAAVGVLDGRMPRPRIGITTYDEPASWSYWREVPAAVVPAAYVESIRAAGGMPYLIPPVDEVGEEAQDVIAFLHGLVVIGGSDVAPDQYGEVPHAASAGWQQ